MTAALVVGAVIGLVMVLVGIRRRRALAPVQRVMSVDAPRAARPRWERHGLRSPAEIPRPVDQLEREVLDAYRRRGAVRAAHRRTRQEDCP